MTEPRLAAARRWSPIPCYPLRSGPPLAPCDSPLFPLRPPRCLQSAADNGLTLPHLHLRAFTNCEVPLSSLSCRLREPSALIRSQRRVVFRAFAPRRPRSLVTHRGLAYRRRVSTTLVSRPRIGPVVRDTRRSSRRTVPGVPHALKLRDRREATIYQHHYSRRGIFVSHARAQ